MAAQQARRRGPQPRGDRVGVTMRVPGDHAETYKQRADDLGIPLSSWITLALAEHEGLPVPDYVQKEIRKASAEREAREREQEINMLDLPRSA
ncbi:hypothetical protein [Microbacterium sp. No. 7]|uniref:hypothetical protein n=1 Tax=Microbacterium sp. No. 7 TaxID=1714373 RepID=UPI0006ECF25C|nr:hypothetical protein [Microbacterium sp. No. 7]ALJ22330.1 hypothetical protein AOA12_22045 [Microbacterium sp. No. 7]